MKEENNKELKQINLILGISIDTCYLKLNNGTQMVLQPFKKNVHSNNQLLTKQTNKKIILLVILLM